MASGISRIPERWGQTCQLRDLTAIQLSQFRQSAQQSRCCGSTDSGHALRDVDRFVRLRFFLQKASDLRIQLFQLFFRGFQDFLDQLSHRAVRLLLPTIFLLTDHVKNLFTPTHDSFLLLLFGRLDGSGREFRGLSESSDHPGIDRIRFFQPIEPVRKLTDLRGIRDCDCEAMALECLHQNSLVASSGFADDKH